MKQSIMSLCLPKVCLKPLQCDHLGHIHPPIRYAPTPTTRVTSRGRRPARGRRADVIHDAPVTHDPLPAPIGFQQVGGDASPVQDPPVADPHIQDLPVGDPPA
ncbi:hypothetical protein V6N13_051095 [Hibiscus sabdariffa]